MDSIDRQLILVQKFADFAGDKGVSNLYAGIARLPAVLWRIRVFFEQYLYTSMWLSPVAWK